MSEASINEFASSLPSIDRFGGAKSYVEAHAAIQAYCSSEEQKVALLYISGMPVDAITDRVQLATDWVRELVIAADDHVSQGRTRSRGRRTVRSVRTSPLVSPPQRPALRRRVEPVVEHVDLKSPIQEEYPFRGSPCEKEDPELFFGTEKSADTRRAKEICGQCAVRAACLQFALDRGQEFGVWGGLTEKERQLIVRGGRS